MNAPRSDTTDGLRTDAAFSVTTPVGGNDVIVRLDAIGRLIAIEVRDSSGHVVATQGRILLDAAEKLISLRGAATEGTLIVKAGAAGVATTLQGKDLKCYEIETCETVDGVKGLWTRMFVCSDRYKSPGQ